MYVSHIRQRLTDEKKKKNQAYSHCSNPNGKAHIFCYLLHNLNLTAR